MRNTFYRLLRPQWTLLKLQIVEGWTLVQQELLFYGAKWCQGDPKLDGGFCVGR